MKPVAVIILNWNGRRLLERFLPSVVTHTPSGVADVIVADNGSDDGSVDMLRSRFPEVEVITFDRNQGFAEGYNLALEATRRPYTVLLNSDVETPEGWLEPLLAFMEANPRCAACQPKIMSAAEPGRFEYAGAAGGFLDRNGYPYCRGRMLDTVEDDYGQYDDDVQVDWASGACLMVRTDAYRDAGGLDASFFAHMEEIDLCWRLRLRGWQVWAVGSSRVYHLGGGSLPAGNPRKVYLNFRNSLLMLHKNLPSRGRAWRLTRRRLLDTLAFARYLLGLDFASARAVIRAHTDYRRMARTLPSAPADIPDPLRARPNLLTSYYLHRRRHFTALAR